MKLREAQETAFKSAYETIKKNFNEANKSLDYLLKERRETRITRASELRKFDFIAQYIDLINETSGLYLDKESHVPFFENRVYYDLIFEYDVKLSLKLKEAYSNSDVFRKKMDLAADNVPLLKKVF